MFIGGPALRVLLVAPLAGAILGLPGQIKRRPAGVRTHALVSLGAAVFCLTGATVVAGDPSEDVLRVVQGIASGVGFIGAAAVLRGDGLVRGINTAASVWIAAAVGASITFVDTPAIGLLAAAFGTAINWIFMELEVRVFGVRPDDAGPDPKGGGPHG